jgi:hypothetical protein
MQKAEVERRQQRLRNLCVRLAACLPLATVIYVASGSPALAAGVAGLDLVLRPAIAAGARRARNLAARTP